MASYYIATTGNDTTGNGSLATPWLTVSKAYTSATNGDTIYVRGGTHSWVTGTQTLGKNITISAYADPTTGVFEVPIFDGGSTSSPSWFKSNGFQVEIIGLSFINNLSTGQTSFTSVDTSTYTFKFTNCRFYGLVSVSNIDSGGLFTTNTGAGAFDMVGCEFFDNEVYDNTTGGGWAGMFTGRAFTNTFTKCAFYFNQTGAKEYKFICVGQTAGPPLKSGTFKNCIVSNEGDTMTALVGGTNGWTATATYTCQYGGWTTPTTGTGNITTDPLFVDAANGDFRLRQGSPCIGTGTLL